MALTVTHPPVRIPDLAVLLAEMVTAARAEADRLLALHPGPAR